jgi:hypothetical protein
MKKVAKRAHQRQFWRPAGPVGFTLFALLLPGCGGAGKYPRTAGSPPASAAIALQARPAPSGWSRVRIPSGAALYYPPGWQPVASDSGTASVALFGPARQILGYLNVTPRQAGETLAGWPSFRVAHNAREGDRRVAREAVARNVRFRSGPGTCVRDSYETASRAHYIELACIVQGEHAITVIVGAAPPSAWPAVSGRLYRALSALTT